jgi:mRNA interferase MazF
MVCDAGDVVIVPFPFTDGPETKRRPALVISPSNFNRASGHAIMVMITAADRSSWPGDVPLDPNTSEQLGLTKPCIIRMKFFTIDNRLIVKGLALLPAPQCNQVRAFLDRLLRQAS